ncbi:TRAP transporter small permease [Bordetella sp. BOR01]|uniref:TRAP transporter small permease n=1 Tax=Bordetella sp. BOR01 TaxID=2854779 RepID=UPI001C47C5B3|nr:TRAP transporter small permease [Bordetella sp. BOR01]MBV7485258.1 TRAP transporter small permease [Bordetella sp. BOR01]
MRTFEKIIKALAYALTVVAAASLLMMMLQTVVDVLLNNLVGAPIEGNLEVISAYHMVLVVFLPLAYVELKHEHISSDIVVGLMPPRWRRAMYVFGALISCLFFAVLAWQTWLDALNSYEIREVIMGSVYVEIWPSKFSLPIGFAAIFLVLVFHILKAITDPGFNPAPAGPDVEPQ